MCSPEQKPKPYTVEVAPSEDKPHVVMHCTDSVACFEDKDHAAFLVDLLQPEGVKVKKEQGFTLIELMVVVAIIGILAAIAIPAYQDFAIRSKMSEPIAAMSACKTSVAEYAAVKAAYPTDAIAAGCSEVQTTYLGSLQVANGVITATSKGTGAKPGECVMTLTPPAGAPTVITSWEASFSGCLSKYVPANFRT